MARKIKTVSPRQRIRANIERDRLFETEEFPSRRPVTHRAKIDLCKIHTWRLRELDYKQIRKAQRGVGRLGQMRRNDPIREALGMYLAKLAGLRLVQHHYAKRRLGWDARDVQLAQQDADRAEAKLKKMQKRAGCQPTPREMVARDAEEQGMSPEDVDFIRRGKRRPRIR